MSLLKKNKKRLLYLIPGIYYIIPFLLKIVYYPISDDYLLTSVVRGAYDGKPGSHLVVINTVLSSLWEKLYKICPNIEWYALTMIILVIFNSYLIFYLLNKRFNNYLSLFVVVLIDTFMLVWPSFTVVAYFSAFTLGLFVFYYVNTNISSFKSLIIIGLITFGGFCFRDQAFESGFVAVAPLIIVSIRKNNIKKIVLSGLVVILLISACMIIHKSTYETGKWHKYYEWMNARSLKGDYPISEYKDNKSLYDSIGYSENDYLGLKSDGYYMADLNTYSTKKMLKIVESTPFNVRYNTNEFSIIVGIIRIKEFWAFVIVLLIMLWINNNKRQLIYSTLEFMAVVGQCAYLFFIGRPGDRILIPLFFFSIMIILFYGFYEVKEKTIGKTVGVICLIIPTILVLLYGKQFLTVNNYQAERQQKYGEIEREIKNNPKKLYVINCHHFVLMNKPIEIIRKPQYYSNILELSNYEVLFSDTYYNVVKKFKLTDKNNLMIDIATDDNVFYIDLDGKNVDKIETYIKEHTGKKPKKKIVKSFNNSKTKIYKISIN